MDPFKAFCELIMPEGVPRFESDGIRADQHLVVNSVPQLSGEVQKGRHVCKVSLERVEERT